MAYMIEVLRQEHCNIESLLRVLERELSVFERGDRPDYEVILAVINYFKDYPDFLPSPKGGPHRREAQCARSPQGGNHRRSRSRASGGSEASAASCPCGRARSERPGSLTPDRE